MGNLILSSSSPTRFISSKEGSAVFHFKNQNNNNQSTKEENEGKREEIEEKLDLRETPDVLLRCRHINPKTKKPTTIFRFLFFIYLSFLRMDKLRKSSFFLSFIFKENNILTYLFYF